MNRDEGLKALETSIKAIEDLIIAKKGTFVLQQAVSFYNINAQHFSLERHNNITKFLEKSLNFIYSV